MEIIDKINSVIDNPMEFNNEFSLIGFHMELIDCLMLFNNYLKMYKKSEEMDAEIEKCYDRLKYFYLKYYMLLYRNSVVEINSKFFSTPVNSIHIIIKESIVNSKILEEDDGLEYYSYERDYKEVEDYIKFDCLERLQKIMQESEDEKKMDIEREEIHSIFQQEILLEDIDQEKAKKKHFKMQLHENNEKIFNNNKSIDDEEIDYSELSDWDLDKMYNVKIATSEHESDDDNDLEDLTAEFNNLMTSDMKDFFKNSNKKVEIFELKTSDFLELFLPQNADKCSMHFFYEYLKVLSICDENRIGDYTSANYCFLSIKFGLSKLINAVRVDKKIKEYTLQDIYSIILQFTDQTNLLYKFVDIVNKNNRFQDTRIKQDVFDELTNFMSVLYKRLYIVINSNDPELINVDIFRCCIDNTKTSKTDIVGNTAFLYYFSHAYRMIFSTLHLNTVFLSETKKKSKKETMLNIEYVDYSNKNPEFGQELGKKFEKFIRKFKGKKNISNKCRWFMYKFCSSTLNRDWYIYHKFNNNTSEQLATIDIIRDNSKIQRKVIEMLEPSYEKWLNEVWKTILIDITVISDFKKKDADDLEKTNKILDDIVDGKKSPENIYQEGLKTEFRNALGIYATHMWFHTSKGYRYWLFRFVVPYEAFLRYGYILLKLLLDDPDKIYREPLIIQYGPFEYAVLSNKKLIYCGLDYFKTQYVWLSEMETHCNSMILPIKTHGEMKKIDNYYPWIYIWKKIYFPKDFCIMNFLNSLSNDSLEIGDIYFEFENNEEKKEEKKEVVQEMKINTVDEETRKKMLDMLRNSN